jgi:hypothetical protein
MLLIHVVSWNSIVNAINASKPDREGGNQDVYLPDPLPPEELFFGGMG